MASLFNFNSKRFPHNDTDDQFTYDSPPNWRPASQDSSNGSTSRSGSSGGFERSSSPINDDSSWSRESSPAFEIILDPDLSYRKEAAQQSQEANGALIASLSSSDNETSPLEFTSSFDVPSHENSTMEDDLWDELMGVPDTEMTELQWEQVTSAPDFGKTGPEEEEGDDEMLAMMTDALDRELEEMQDTQQLAAENEEAAESARKKALLDEQIRVAAEKAALAKQFDQFHKSPKKKSKAGANKPNIYRLSLTKKSSRLIGGMGYEDSRIIAARRARREALKAKASDQRRARVPTPMTIPPEVVTLDTVAVNTTKGRNTTKVPASQLGDKCTVSAAATSMQSTETLPRVYHRADLIDWRPIWERMSLSKFHTSHKPSSVS